jgi:hypothetical protein
MRSFRSAGLRLKVTAALYLSEKTIRIPSVPTETSI